MASTASPADICRVCRSPGSPSDPLFHPCKCSGSMKFVHQLCLEQWLKVSRKQECEICQTKFSFIPVYAENVPREISNYRIFLYMTQKLAKTCSRYYRAAVALFMWACWVPYTTIWTWRLFMTPAVTQSAIASLDDIFMSQKIFTLSFWSSITLNPFEESSFLRPFFGDVVEGMIIIVIGLVCAITIFYVQSYIMAHTPRDPQGRLIVPPEENPLDQDPFFNPDLRPPAPAPAPPRRQRRPIPLEEFGAPRAQRARRQPRPDPLLPLPEQPPTQRVIIQPRERRQDHTQETQPQASSTSPSTEVPTSSYNSHATNSPPLAAHPPSIFEPSNSCSDTNGKEKASAFEQQSLSSATNTLPSGAGSSSGNNPSTSSETTDRKGKAPAFEYQPIQSEFTQSTQSAHYLTQKDLEDLKALDEHLRNQAQQRFRDLELKRQQEEFVRVLEGLSQDLPRPTSSASYYSNASSDIGTNSQMPTFPSTQSATLLDDARYRDLTQLYQNLTPLPTPAEARRPPDIYRPLNLDSMKDPLLARLYTTSSEEIQAQQISSESSGANSFGSNIRRFDSVMPRSAPVILDHTRPPPLRHPSSPLASASSIVPDLSPIEFHRTDINSPAAAPGMKASLSDDELKNWMDEDLHINNPENNDSRNGNGNNRQNDAGDVVNPVPAVNPPEENMEFQVGEDDEADEIIARLNLNIDIGGGEAIQIEGEADIEPLLNMFGVQGSWSSLMQNVFLTQFIVFIATGVFAWLPALIGRMFVYFLTDMYAPLVELVVKNVRDFVHQPQEMIKQIDSLGIGWMQWLGQKVDVVLDLVADVFAFGVIILLKVFDFARSFTNSSQRDAGELSVTASSAIKNATIEAVTTNSSSTQDAIETLMKNSSIVSSLNDTSSTSANATILSSASSVGMFGNHLYENLWWVMIGYNVIAMVMFAILVRSQLVRHPYVVTFKNLVRSFMTYSYWLIKLVSCLLIEGVLVSAYCGMLMDALIQPLFSNPNALSDRIAMIKAYPIFIGFAYWASGMVYMYMVYKYVMILRDVARPGVFFFLRNPEDPNNNLLNETMKPLSYQFKKLFNGIRLYTSLAVGSVGFAVGFVWLMDKLWSLLMPYQFLPLNNNIDDRFFAFFLAADYFFPGFLLSVFRGYRITRGIVGWFTYVTKTLRLSAFIFGVHRVEEESDEEDNSTTDSNVPFNGSRPVKFGSSELTIDTHEERIRRRFKAQKERSSRAAQTIAEDEDGSIEILTESEDDEWEDEAFEAPSGTSSRRTAPKQQTKISREYRYMRVPNRDLQNVNPGETFLVPMKEEDPVFGRDGETPGEVEANWCKVYVPDRFFLRIRALILSQALAISFVAALTVFATIISGRFCFFVLQSYTIFRFDLPSLFAFSDPSQTPDPIMSDAYTLIIGVLMLQGFHQFYGSCKKLISALKNKTKVKFVRQNAVYWKAGTPKPADWGKRRLRPETSAKPEPTPFQEWFSEMSSFLYRLTIWTVLGIVICPTLAGLTIDLCFVRPMKRAFYNLDSSFSFFHTWLIGICVFKVCQYLVASGPDWAAQRHLAQMRFGGIERLNTKTVLKASVAFIIVSCCLIALYFAIDYSLPFDLNDPKMNLVLRWITFMEVVGFAYFVISYFRRSGGVQRTWMQWAEMMRNEQYLVGRRLQNFADQVR